MKHIAVIGTGYVGLVTGACFAELGNHVVCVDCDHAKVAKLRNSELPLYEPGLAELVRRNGRANRLRFCTSAAEGIVGSEIVFISVGTPMSVSGEADLSSVRDAAAAIADHLDSDKIVVNKSTVPVETGDLVRTILAQRNRSGFRVAVVSNPEFLREGSAIVDFMKPDRVVLGVHDGTAEATMRELYAPLDARIIITDVRTAEMIKYTANAFLALRLSFINEISKICERVGADIRDVIAGAGADHRIGTAYLSPGLGFGGSSFQKDIRTLARIAERSGVTPRMLSAILDVNAEQIAWCVDRLQAHLGAFAEKRVGMLGLAFKQNTDDVRESPAIALALELRKRGASVVVHDPEALERARLVLRDSVAYASDAEGVAPGADAIVVATDWNEYKQLDFDALKAVMRRPLLFDARNMYDEERLCAGGWEYVGVGKRSRAFVSARNQAAT
jgi:UDPglucose 6-dehydrogenase